MIVGNQMYFRAGTTGVEEGSELYVTDGTAAGTHLVADINPGSGSSSPTPIASIGNRLFFTASDPAYGIELWSTDGTTSGTTRLSDIKPGATSSFAAGDWANGSYAIVNGQFFFAADDGVNGSELWRSDGTAAGTVRVTDINPGSDASSPALMTAVGSNLFFAATDPTHGREMWMLGDEFAPILWPGNYSPVNNQLTVSMNESVDIAQLNAVLQLTNLSTGQSIPSSARSITWDASTTTATAAFSNLPDGNYRAQIPANTLADPSGNTITSDYTTDFFILTADANHDRTVNALDFNTLATNYGKPGTFSQGDFDYSGTIGSNDFASLASK
jgi:ELWxxDGT repeat protein